MNTKGCTEMSKIAIRKYSMENPWIDFTVLISEEDEERAKEALDKASELMWSDEDEDGEEYYWCFGDAVEYCLEHAHIEHRIVYPDDFDDYDEEYSEQYIEWFDNLECLKTVGEW